MVALIVKTLIEYSDFPLGVEYAAAKSRTCVSFPTCSYVHRIPIILLRRKKKKFLLNVKMNVNGKMELESRPYNFKKSCLKII